ncbi:flagellar hook-associated protein FlgK [Noviherbaspirillum sp.]|uniref:flagellar hook-associated protein FlgK n=1 Tax=Noviherbaspirillum sp. TaxID=1926288 RepID=UPI002B490C4E|nr:flagellar hook-associated protein FlgK [Noviherbaspirillum sp.]HJV79594.1 flagellar hook-associated protein FlgK [Noviherbaspirillum sp.]
MASSILGVGQSALNAAQTGLVTTGHNIANVNTPGYSRQEIVQVAAPAQNIGVGFVGKGTEVSNVQRVFDQYLYNQVLSSQVSKYSVDSYYSQIKQIDNLLADPTAGVSSAMQDFFDGVQDVASNPSSAASRQAMLSSATALAARFQSVGGRLNEMRQGVNDQITTSIGVINTYAQQIANLNDAIEKAQGTSGDSKPANDLLDQRDQLISELSKEIKVTTVKQGNSVNVSIGNGQALTVGTQVFKLVPVTSQTDPSKIQVGYLKNGAVSPLADSSLPGGKLGGLLDFRTNSLDPAQNSLGRVATGLAMTFNAQHQLGQDQNGAIGGNFFTAGAAQINPSSQNNQTAPIASIGAAITDASKLTTSDYRLQFVGGNYVVTRLSDNTQLYSNAAFPAAANVIEGVTLTNTGTFTAGDEFIIKPTANGASGFGVAINDIAKIAAAAPIRTVAPTANTGTGTISAGTVNAPPPANPDLQQPVTITFTSATTFNVTGTGTGNPTGLTYTAGGNITYNGWTVQISGAPASGDTFTIGPNTNGTGDNRNALLLGGLQTANTLANGTSTYQGAYTYMVSQVGNKTRELEVTSRAEDKMLEQSIEAQQATSGVNLDEEAANMMRYQQAYQAAAKVMQTASQLFEMLLNLGQ